MVQVAHIAQPGNTSILAMRRSASTAGQRRMEVVAPTVRPKNTGMAQATASAGGVDRSHLEADALTALQRLMKSRRLDIE